MNDLPILKYVILDGEIPVIFPQALQHSTMVPMGHKAIGAGFLMLMPDRIVVADIGSETLKLGPRPQDHALLQKTLRP